MERLTAVFDDEQIIVDGVSRKVPGLSGSYQNLHAVQHDSSGTEVEYADKSPNSPPSDSNLVADLHQRWKDAEQRTVYDSQTGEAMTITVADSMPTGYQAEKPQSAVLAEKRRNMVVSRFQARAALNNAGLLSQAETIVANSDDPVTQIAWEDAAEFRRNSPTIAALADELGLDDQALDQLFEDAATIEA